MRRSFIFSTVSVLTFISLLLVSCDDTKNTDLPTIPTKDVSFSEHIEPIFNLNCNYGGCHNASDHAGGLALDNWANTTASYLVVAPGYPDNSQLVLAVEGKSTYPMPPLAYQQLTREQITGIRTWVKEGAKNN